MTDGSKKGAVQGGIVLGEQLHAQVAPSSTDPGLPCTSPETVTKVLNAAAQDNLESPGTLEFGCPFEVGFGQESNQHHGRILFEPGFGRFQPGSGRIHEAEDPQCAFGPFEGSGGWLAQLKQIEEGGPI